MRIVGIIPARYESSRFPGKPLALIQGKPMIWWVYQQAKKVKGLENVWVATDSERICEECDKYDIPVMMTSSEHQTGTDRLGEVAQKIEADFYVNIQGDEPLIEPETIQSVIEYYKKNLDVQVINTKTVIKDSKDINDPTVVKVVSADNGEGIYLSRAPIPYPKKEEIITYYKHLGLYGLTREALAFFSKTERGTIEKIEDIEMMRFLEHGIGIRFIIVQSSSIGVDTIQDLKNVESIMERKNE